MMNTQDRTDTARELHKLVGGARDALEMAQQKLDAYEVARRRELAALGFEHATEAVTAHDRLAKTAGQRVRSLYSGLAGLSQDLAGILREA